MVYSTNLTGREGQRARAIARALYGHAERGNYDKVVQGLGEVQVLSRSLPADEQKDELIRLVNDRWSFALGPADGNPESPHNRILEYLRRL